MMHRHLSLVLGIPLFLGACNVVGPQAIVNGRATYNTVINQTEDEQILAMLVRQRYDETFGMLAVASVTASIRAATSVGANVGIGPSSNYETNLVIYDRALTQELEADFFADEKKCVPFSAEDYDRRPRTSRLVNSTLRLCSPLL